MKKTLSFLLLQLLICRLLLAQCGRADTVRYYQVDQDAQAIARADFNFDGNTDLAVASPGNVTIFASDASGIFAQAFRMTLHGKLSDIAAADWNRDGKTDLVAAAYNDNALYLFVNTGAGFSKPSRIPVRAPSALAVADLNNDKIQDLAVTSFGLPTGALILFTGDGEGKLRVFKNLPARAPTDLIAVDLDRDLAVDFAVTNYLDATVSLYFSAGNGVYQLSETVPAPEAPLRILSGDIDNNGAPDLIVSGEYGYANVLLSSGFHAFRTSATLKVQPSAGDGVLTDLNDDSNIDLIISNRVSDFYVFRGNGDGTFQRTSSVPEASAFSTLISDDFNHDQKPDIGYTFQNLLAILPGNGKGGFTTGSTRISGPREQFLGSFMAGEFTNDRNIDLISSSYYGTYLRAGKGNGTFHPVKRLDLPQLSYPTVADFNADGISDIAAFRGRKLTVYLGTGEPGFRITSVHEVPIDPEIFVSDVNGDGFPDMTLHDGQALRTFVNKGNGSFKPAVLSKTVTSIIATGEFNSDSFADVAVFIPSYYQNGSKVVLYRGNGSGKFLSDAAFPVPPCVYSIFSADVNADGRSDILASGYCDAIILLIADGNGGFHPAQSIPAVPGELFPLLSADLNGDGRPDIATISHATGKPSVLISTSNSGSQLAFSSAELTGAYGGFGQMILADFINGGAAEIFVANGMSGSVLTPCGR